jgi:hypothetical protein
MMMRTPIRAEIISASLAFHLPSPGPGETLRIFSELEGARKRKRVTVDGGLAEVCGFEEMPRLSSRGISWLGDYQSQPTPPRT